MKLAAIPAAGIVGLEALREAAATEFGQVSRLVSAAISRADPSIYDISAIYPDRAVYTKGRDGKQYAYPYSISDDNQVTLGTPYEVVTQHVPAASAAPVREALQPTSAAQAGGGEKTNNATALQGDVFIEAAPGEDAAKPTRYLVRVIRAGTSLNNVTYPPAVLREAAAKFDGVRVFVKSDDEHIKGGGKDFRQLVGRLSDAKFVEADGGQIQATLDVLDSSDVAAKLREAVQRGMTDLFGLSIDATGASKKNGKFREATSISRVDSVDLIIEPGAGGQFIRFAEAASNHEENTMLRQQMIDTIRRRDAKRADSLADATDADVLAAFREAVAVEGSEGNGGGAAGGALTHADLAAHTRLVEARADARVSISASKLPAAIQERLMERFREAAEVTPAIVSAAIEEERKFLGRLVEGAQVRGLGEGIEMGEGQADKAKTMLDDFFDKSKGSRISFREAYVAITGDRRVTGRIEDCDMGLLRECAQAYKFREAVSSSTWGNVLGDSITRAMIREYQNNNGYTDWRWLVDVVSVNDFRQQQRTRMGGYGDLPGVAENGSYTALASPSDEVAKYAPTKRGGIETISLEAIANDDVGAIRRIPVKLSQAAASTLYKFVYGFLDGNGLIYDGKALFHADHGNLGTDAFSDASFNAARLAMRKQAEAGSNARLGLALRHLAVPAELEGAAWDMFRRDTNLDATFTQSAKPTVHVVEHWTDADNWYAAADISQIPLIELGFYGGKEDPELFVQDLPTQGSLFSNDQIKYKIRHIYGGAVLDYRGLFGSLVA